MKIVIFVEFGTVLLLLTNIRQCQIQNFCFSWDLICGGNLVCNFKFIMSDKFAKLTHVSNHHQSITLEFLDFHVFSPYPGNQLKVKIIKDITTWLQLIFYNLNSTLIFCSYLWLDASQVKRRRAESYLRNKSFIELGLW